MNYIIKKTDNEKQFEVTYLKERETVSGEKVEVVEGKNIIDLDKLIETITKTEEENKALIENQVQYLSDLQKMLDKINEVISE